MNGSWIQYWKNQFSNSKKNIFLSLSKTSAHNSGWIGFTSGESQHTHLKFIEHFSMKNCIKFLWNYFVSKSFIWYSKFYLLTAYSLWLTAYVTHTGKQVYTTVVLQLYKLPNQVVLRHHFLFDKNYFYLFTTSMLKRFFNWTVYLKIN